MTEKCEVCKKEKAVWLYMPATDNKIETLFCDKCIDPYRGCSCNISEIEYYLDDIKNIEDEFLIFYKLDLKNESFEETSRDKATHVEFLDENKKRFPCVEYDYDENGFDFSDIE